MLKRAFLLGLLFAPLPLMAQTASVQDQIIGQLRDQGFTRIEVSRTLLGRVQLHATSDQLERELVFNPVTGEILRDYWEPHGGGERRAPRVLNPGSSDEGERSRSASGDGRSGSGGSGSSSSGSSGKGSGASGSSGSGSGGSGHDDKSESGDDSDDDSKSGKGEDNAGDDSSHGNDD